MSEETLKTLIGRKYLHLISMPRVVSVIGEQKYVNLTDDLKALLDPPPEETADPNKSYLYGGTRFMESFRVHAARALVRCGDEDGIRYTIEQLIPSPVIVSSAPYYAVRTLKYIIQEFGTDLSSEFRFLILDKPNAQPGAFRELVQVEAYCRLSGDLASADVYRRLLDECIATKRGHPMWILERPIWRECIKLIGDLLPYERGALQRLPSPGPPPVTYVDAFLELRKVRETMSARKYNIYLKSIYLGEVESTKSSVLRLGATGLKGVAIVGVSLLLLGILVVLVVYVSFA